MSNKIYNRAKELAKRPHTILISFDKTTDGMNVVVARNPELEGCMAQGIDTARAIANLDDARVEYYASLLEDGETVTVGADATY